MSQIKSPEKKRPRKSLSLSKNRTSGSPKSKTSKSSTIEALFKNAPPAKLSCPLCKELVPRFGISRHMDESCPKANNDEKDVILIEDDDCVISNVPRSQPQEDNTSIATTTEVTVRPSAKLDKNEKQISPYFNKNGPISNIPNELPILKSAASRSLSSRLTRKYQTRKVKRDLSKDVNPPVPVEESGHTEGSTQDTSDVKNSTLHTETILKIEENRQKQIIDNIYQSIDCCSNSSECIDKVKSAKELHSAKLEECTFLGANHGKISEHGNLCGDSTALCKQYDKKANMSSPDDKSPLHPLVDSNVLDEFSKPFYDEDYQNKGENIENGTDSSMRESTNEDSRHPYYLRNFLMVLNTIMECDDDMSLFNEADCSTLTSFFKLSAGSQKLYVRLFQRKLNWIKVNKIEYSEIGSDLVPFIEELVQNKFLQSDSELQELSEALDLLPAPELKTLAKGFHLANATAQKQQLVDEFLRLSRQRSFFSMGKNQLGIAAVILKKCKQLIGRAVRVCREPRAVFSRVLLLFSLTDSMEVEEAAGGGQSQLSTVLMVNMGRVIFPPYTVSKTTRIFQDREDLMRYESAMHKLVELVVTMTNGNWKEAHLLYQNAGKDWDELTSDVVLRHHESLPVYLRSFTFGWVYTRIRSRGVEILQRLHLYSEAVDLLQTLLSQHVYCPDSRGRWWDRLVLNLHQHLKCTEKAIGFIMEGLSDPFVRTGHKLSLYQRAVRMRESPSCKKFHHMFSDLPKLEVDDVPHVTIKGKLYPNTGMGKSVFLMEDITGDLGEDNSVSTVMCSVEELALAHYRDQGFDQGIHGEGSTFSTLYGLLMWDIIFMEGIPDVFRNSYQSFPLDLYTDCFFENRREAVETRLRLLEESCPETLVQMIADVWSAHEGEAGALVSWERFTSLQQAQSLVSCFGGPFLSGVCKIMSKDIRHCRGGLPDLVIWNMQTKQYKLVEVKGPTDRLSHKQMVWLHELNKLGATVEVCHVVAIGAKSNRLN
ncbi:fanconi-associated nuclease 1 [Pelobates fuscus]|uniref:fanconi-associated nuclease 1 n=1 Tax=Pelobates fuscus TaxID=191477 RepID=UPI002FE4872C